MQIYRRLPQGSRRLDYSVMKTEICRLVGDLKLQRIYTCAGCGTFRAGTTERLHVDCSNAAELADILSRGQLSGHHMPVGWASYYGGAKGDIYVCPPCNEKRKLEYEERRSTH